MNSLSYQTKELIRKQLFRTDIEDAHNRWGNFQSELLGSDNIVPLWSNSNFRWGYYLIENLVDDTDERYKEVDPEEVVKRINDNLICEGDDAVDTCDSLIRGLEILIESSGILHRDESEETIELMKDLKVFRTVAKMLAESSKTEEKYNKEIENLLGERKPLKKAA